MLRFLFVVLLAAPAQAEPLEAPALVRSKARLELRSPLAVPITHAPLAEGERFEKGDRLVAFDCRSLEAEWLAARASARAASLEARSKKRLLSHGAVGSDEVAQARARHAEASARGKALAARLGSCTIRAPFSGRVIERGSRPGEVPRADRPVLTIVDDLNLEVELVAPSLWLAWVEVGATLTVAIEETARSFPSRIVRVGAEVDPVSRTVRIYGAVPPGAGVLPGMSGQARFGSER